MIGFPPVGRDVKDPHPRDIAFGCREGNVGIWDAEHNVVNPKWRVEGYADLVGVSPSGEYIVAAGGNGVVTLYDLFTDLSASYRGHESRVAAVTAPSQENPVLLSADVKGTLRVWPLPTRVARVATNLNSQFNTGVFDKHSHTVVTTTYSPALTTFSPVLGVRTVGPHEPHDITLVQSTDGATIAAYGLNELVELWSVATMKRTNVLNTKQGSLTQLSFVDNTDNFVTSGRDGRLVQRTPSGDEMLIAHLDQPIVSFALLPADTAHLRFPAVFSSFDGALWHASSVDQPVRFRPGDTRISRLITLPDHLTVLAGNISGEVVAINTETWKYDTVLRADGAIREISVTPDGRWIVVGANDGHVYVGKTHINADWPKMISWQKLRTAMRHQVVTSDGLLMVVSDGLIWLYSMPQQRWLCLPVQNADFRWITTSADDAAAAVLDVEGRLIWIDIDAARKLI